MIVTRIRATKPPVHPRRARLRADRLLAFRVRVLRDRQRQLREAGGVLIEGGAHWVRVTFASSPPRVVADALRRAGFARARGCWHGRRRALPPELALAQVAPQ